MNREKRAMKIGNKGSFSLGMIVLVWLMLVSAPAWADFGGGSGTTEDPWQIATPAQLDHVRDYLGSANTDKHFVLTADIDLDVLPYNSGDGWEPVGAAADENRFFGHFDGAGHTISGLFINRPGEDFVGLFGYAEEASFKNITLLSVNVTGRDSVGALLGRSNAAAFSNLKVHGTVAGRVQIGGVIGVLEQASTAAGISADIEVTGTGNRTGGLSGFVYTATIADSQVTGQVTGGGDHVGGLVGHLEGRSPEPLSAVINGSSTNVAVSGAGWHTGGLAGYASNAEISNSHAAGVVAGAEGVGGLAGFAEHASVVAASSASGNVDASGNYTGGLIGYTGEIAISSVYATGTVTAAGNNIGGLIGETGGSASIGNAYAMGPVSGGNNVGGLIGEIHGGSVITNAYATGLVSGSGSGGGLIGNNNSDAGVVTDSYYDSVTTGRADTGKGEPRTTEEMKRQSTFFGWDFATIWAIREDIAYPHLQWQLASDFSATPVSGPSPLTVQFADESTGDPTGWAWYFGDEDWAAGSWVEMVSSAGWTGRYNHTSVALPDGSIVLMGGQGDGGEGGHFRDVWRSIDQGETWVETTPAATWSARNSHASVALPDGSIVLMGGRNSGGYESDVWRSTDGGATWTEMTNSAGWAARAHHAAVALPDGSILLMGGYNDADYGTTLGDVWHSTDRGATWTELTGAAEWPARNSATSVALPDGSILLLGGSNASHQELNDVWRSTDQGETWAQVTPGAEWSVRYGTTGVALPDGSIVLVGGGNYGTNDVWRSTDLGESWAELTDSAPWPPRGRHTSIALPDGSIVLMGGYAGPKFNDVWRLETAGSSEQSPSHTYTEPGVYSVALQSYNTNGTSSIARQDYLTVAGVSQFTVTPSAGAGGSISPSTPQLVNLGATASFTVTPEAGYTAQVGGTCGGSLTGATFTTDVISADCTVEANFVLAVAGDGDPPPADDPSGPASAGGSSGCFIATAAYGSPLASQVMVLRDFRDRYLLTNGAGRWLVNRYYHYSPPLAEGLAQSDTLRRLVRWGLTPLVLALQYPLMVLLLLGLGGGGLVALTGRNAWSGPVARRLA
jgi:PKD repeat protein